MPAERNFWSILSVRKSAPPTLWKPRKLKIRAGKNSRAAVFVPNSFGTKSPFLKDLKFLLP